MNKQLLFMALLVQLIVAFSLKAAEYTYLGLVGTATAAGWVPQGIPMVKSSANHKIFTYSGMLNPGELKIHTENGDWCDGDWIMPTTDGQSITNTAHIISSGCGSPDNKWVITPANQGIYTITINVETMDISFVKRDYYPNLYLIGGATPGGWSLENATPMIVDGGNQAIFTWTGNLIEGNFKIATNLTFEGNFDWIHPLSNGQSFSLTDAEFVLSGNTDHQWTIGASDEGVYAVTVNMTGANPTVQIVKTGSLPLNFLSFIARSDNNLARQVTLNWQTTNEVNTQSFDIERSKDGRVFEAIGNVPANNVSGINNYVFKDENALTGIVYYRLKQIDNDGKYTYSAVVSVDNKENLKFSVYPNPCTDYVSLNYQASTSATELSIVNIGGEKVISQKIAAGIETNRTIDVSSIPSGYYMVVLKDGENKSFTRFVKK